jgi:hypothetical protein
MTFAMAPLKATVKNGRLSGVRRTSGWAESRTQAAAPTGSQGPRTATAVAFAAHTRKVTPTVEKKARLCQGAC